MDHQPGQDSTALEQDERQRALEARASALGRIRRIAARCALVGCAAGGITAHYAGVSLSRGMVWVGLPCALFGWGIGYWLNRRATA